MKKFYLVSLSALLLLSSCGTYTGTGAYAGGMFGSIIGSAVGGLSGGRHGSNVGTLIGMAGGAAVGAAVGAAADNAQQRKYEEYRAERQQQIESRQHNYGGQMQSQGRYDDQADSGYDPTGSGDDRLYGFGEDLGSAPAQKNEKLAGNVATVRAENGRVIFTDILGISTAVEGTIDSIDLLENLIYITQPATA